jgi:hypothetical protein
MRDTPIPWIGLAAVLAMFVFPFLPDWLIEGPRTTRHWPRHHICGDCGASWTRKHICMPEAGSAASARLPAELRRLTQQDISRRALTGKRGTKAGSKTR